MRYVENRGTRTPNRRPGGSAGPLVPAVEALEGRALLARFASPMLPTLRLSSSPGRHFAGEAVTLTALSLPGSLAQIPLTYRFQERTTPGGPWHDLAPISRSNTITVALESAGRHQFRVQSKILVDGDAAVDRWQGKSGFDKIMDWSDTGMNPRELSTFVPYDCDLILNFTSNSVLLAAAPAIRPPVLPVSDQLRITAIDTAYIDTIVMEDGVPVTKLVEKKPGTVVFDGTLREGPNGQDLPSDTIVAAGIAVFAPPPPNRTFIHERRHVILLDGNKDVSDVFDMTMSLNPGKEKPPRPFYSFTFQFKSDSGKPLKVFELPKPEKDKPAPEVPEGSISVENGTPRIPETGELQDITPLVFPAFYAKAKDGSFVLRDRARKPPLKIEVLSDKD